MPQPGRIPLAVLTPFFGRRNARLIALVLALFFGAGGGLLLRGKVITVADGDTFTVLSTSGSPQKVRVYGIDCPESHQTGGPEATALTSSLVLWNEVELTVMDTDRYQRSVALVKLPDGRLLNEELIIQGQAWVYKAYCRIPQCDHWLALEAEARKKKRGLWQQNSPEPPWKWRARHRR